METLTENEVRQVSGGNNSLAYDLGHRLGEHEAGSTANFMRYVQSWMHQLLR